MELRLGYTARLMRQRSAWWLLLALLGCRTATPAEPDPGASWTVLQQLCDQAAVRPGESFTCALRREATGRRFRVRFDLTKPVSAPPAPW